jgi:iron-only hydrogenase group A
MPLTIQLDQQTLRIDQPGDVLGLLQREGKTLYQPEWQELQWINNPGCPLVNLLEVDGRVVSLLLWANRPLRDGMVIRTRSEALEAELTERLQQLRNRGECRFIRHLQEFAAAEAESSGLVNLETRSAWQFEPRISVPSIFHDPNVCVRCQACVDECNMFQGVGALRFDEKLGVLFDDAKCTRCGQCIHRCPMGMRKIPNAGARWMGCMRCPFSRPLGAMREVDQTQQVGEALETKYVVVQFAPAVRATLGEEFGMPPGSLTVGQLYAALRRLGCRQVWDTNFAADLTIMEEGHEFLHRLQNSGRLPMFTSCSPAWIRYCETFYPDLIPHLSTAKSPQQMFGAAAKTYAAQKLGVDPRQMFVVSIMPCTAKKFEASRPEMDSACRYWRQQGLLEPHEHFPDVDVVLTSREAAKLLKMAKIHLPDMPEEPPDSLLGRYTGAATIFGRTGGVMEAALRTAYELATGQPLPKLEFETLGTMEGMKTASIPLDGMTLRVAVVHTLGNAREVCQSVREGGQFAQFHFIEFMACEGGCIGGGGQPIPTDLSTRKARTYALNQDDRRQPVRKSHLNPEIQQLYQDFLQKPLGHLSHLLLHTSYVDRSQPISAEKAPSL